MRRVCGRTREVRHSFRMDGKMVGGDPKCEERPDARLPAQDATRKKAPPEQTTRDDGDRATAVSGRKPASAVPGSSWRTGEVLSS